MKTIHFLSKKIILKSIVGLFGLTIVSCGSYQNKSYYDRDGIYGAEKQENVVQNEEQPIQSNNQSSESTNKYKEYFGTNANKYSNNESEVFTDVDSYSSDYSQDQNQNNNQSYSGWGNNGNGENVTVNVYGNN